MSVDSAAPIRTGISRTVPDYTAGSTAVAMNCSSLPRPMPRRIGELDGIRAIAILLVIGCHYEVFARQLWSIAQFGWLGVDMFFALSGYLITSVLLGLKDKENALETFYSPPLPEDFPSVLFVPSCHLCSLFGGAGLYIIFGTTTREESFVPAVFW